MGQYDICVTPEGVTLFFDWDLLIEGISLIRFFLV